MQLSASTLVVNVLNKYLWAADQPGRGSNALIPDKAGGINLHTHISVWAISAVGPEH